MTYLLDSDTCITHLRPRGKHQVSTRIGATSPSQIALPCIVVSELLYGAWRHPQRARAMVLAEDFCAKFKAVAFDESAARLHAQIRAELETINGRIGPYDSIIAAMAVANHLTLVTHNTREFGRVPGLKIEDWFIP